MNINSYILKLIGKAELPHEIEAGHNYHVSLDGSIVKVELHDNDDGSWNKVFTFRPVKIDVLDPLGKSIRLKDPRKNSQKLRNYLFKVYSEEGYTEEFEKVYDAFTLETMLMTPELLRSAIKRLENKHE